MGVDLYAGHQFFLHIGVKIWGVDLYVQSTYTRVYTVSENTHSKTINGIKYFGFGFSVLLKYLGFGF